MRNVSLSIAMLAALAACGPSNKELSVAKQARYQGDKLVLFGAVKAAVESKHQLAKSDETALGMQTVARWYRSDGVVSRGTDENFQDIPNDSIRMTLVVRMVPDGEHWLVQVEPNMYRRISGSPQPQPLDPKDPSLPGWTQGQVDTLQFEIYSALRPYEVKAPGGIAPAPEAAPAAPAPAADPAAPAAPADPADPAATPAP